MSLGEVGKREGVESRGDMRLGGKQLMWKEEEEIVLVKSVVSQTFLRYTFSFCIVKFVSPSVFAFHILFYLFYRKIASEVED